MASVITELVSSGSLQSVMPLAPTGSDVVALTPLFASVDNGSLMVFVPFLITTRAENACSIYCQ